VAVTNVVMTPWMDNGQTNHITADKAVYAYSVAALVTNRDDSLSPAASHRHESRIRSQPFMASRWF